MAEVVIKRLQKGELTHERDDGSRTRVWVLTTGETDADNETVDPTGGDFSRYQKNGVVIWNHDTAKEPIGTMTDLPWNDYIGEGTKYPEIHGPRRMALLGRIHFSKEEQGEKAWRMVNENPPTLKAGSISFVPEPGTVQRNASGGNHYPKWKLLEFSLCSVGSNESAVATKQKSLTVPVEEKKPLDPGKYAFKIGDRVYARELIRANGTTFAKPGDPLRIVREEGGKLYAENREGEEHLINTALARKTLDDDLVGSKSMKKFIRVNGVLYKKSTSSEVTSPTETSTSTEAYTADNFTTTVTGGAGDGDTIVNIFLSYPNDPDGGSQREAAIKAAEQQLGTLAVGGAGESELAKMRQQIADLKDPSKPVVGTTSVGLRKGLSTNKSAFPNLDNCYAYGVDPKGGGFRASAKVGPNGPNVEADGKSEHEALLRLDAAVGRLNPGKSKAQGKAMKTKFWIKGKSAWFLKSAMPTAFIHKAMKEKGVDDVTLHDRAPEKAEDGEWTEEEIDTPVEDPADVPVEVPVEDPALLEEEGPPGLLHCQRMLKALDEDEQGIEHPRVQEAMKAARKAYETAMKRAYKDFADTSDEDIDTAIDETAAEEEKAVEKWDGRDSDGAGARNGKEGAAMWARMRQDGDIEGGKSLKAVKAAVKALCKSVSHQATAEVHGAAAKVFARIKSKATKDEPEEKSEDDEDDKDEKKSKKKRLNKSEHDVIEEACKAMDDMADDTSTKRHHAAGLRHHSASLRTKFNKDAMDDEMAATVGPEVEMALKSLYEQGQDLKSDFFKATGKRF